MHISVVVGNPKAGSRTLGVAIAVADALSAVGADPNDHRIVDLAEVASELYSGWRASRGRRQQ
jgi:hypothetical protein